MQAFLGSDDQRNQKVTGVTGVTGVGHPGSKKILLQLDDLECNSPLDSKIAEVVAKTKGSESISLVF